MERENEYVRQASVAAFDGEGDGGNGNHGAGDGEGVRRVLESSLVSEVVVGAERTVNVFMARCTICSTPMSATAFAAMKAAAVDHAFYAHGTEPGNVEMRERKDLSDGCKTRSGD